MHRAKRVTRAGQTAAGAVGKEAVLTVLTLQAGITGQAGALTSALITFIWVQDALSPAAAVTSVVWVESNACKVQSTTECKHFFQLTLFKCSNLMREYHGLLVAK